MIDKTVLQVIREEVHKAVRQAVEEIARSPSTTPPTPVVVAEAKPEPKYLSTREAADVANVDTNTIRDWVGCGKLTRYQAGRKLRVERGDLDRFMSGKNADGPRRPIDTDDLARKLLGNSRR